MKKSQWNVLTIASWLGMFFFIYMDSFWNICYDVIFARPLDYVIATEDVWCIVNGEILEPFIYLTFGLAIVFTICGFLENKE